MQIDEFYDYVEGFIYHIFLKVNYKFDLLRETLGEFLIKTFGEFFGHQQLMMSIEIIQLWKMWMELKDIGKYLRDRFILVVLTFNEPYTNNEVN